MAHVGLILVSHSRAIAEGLAELVRQVAGPNVAIEAVGGAADGSLGTDGEAVEDALRRQAEGGAVVLVDLGSALLAVRAALAELGPKASSRLILCDAPIVEGAVAAGVTASTGALLHDVAAAARAARTVAKL